LVLAYKKKQQKNRSFISFKNFKLRFGNSAILALSSGFLSFKTIKNFYIIFKKVFKSSKSITKFWIYLNVYYIITKKPLNVRMGKGKGSRKGRLSLVKSGNSLIELKYCRFGLFYKLYRYISVRCSFNTNYLFLKSKGTSRFNINTSNYNIKLKNFKKLKNKLYISNRMDEILDIYGKSTDLKRYGRTLMFFNRYYSKSCYYLVLNGRKNFDYSFYYLNHYFKKKKLYNFLYSNLHKHLSFFWLKLKRRKIRRKRRIQKNYNLYKKYKKTIHMYKKLIIDIIKGSNLKILNIKKNIKKNKYKKKYISKLKSKIFNLKASRSFSINKFISIKKKNLLGFKFIRRRKRVRICKWLRFKLKNHNLFIVKKKNLALILNKKYNF
jgi:large subunit ribosomal protein L16